MLDQITDAVASQPDEFLGQFRDRQCIISIAEAKRHFWSPWLNIEVWTTDSASMLFGRYSPHPTIWSAFAFTYLVMGIAVFFSLIVGCSQQLAEEFPWGYFVAPVCVIIAFLLWLVSQIGQRLAAVEIMMMQSLIETVIAQNQPSET